METCYSYSSSQEEPANWQKLRPVSLTDHFAKLAEGYIVKWLFEDIQPSLDLNQYGNRPHRSTSHYLFHLVGMVTKHAEKPGSISTVVVKDYNKA